MVQIEGEGGMLQPCRVSRALDRIPIDEPSEKFEFCQDCVVALEGCVGGDGLRTPRTSMLKNILGLG